MVALLSASPAGWLHFCERVAHHSTCRPESTGICAPTPRLLQMKRTYAHRRTRMDEITARPRSESHTPDAICCGILFSMPKNTKTPFYAKKTMFSCMQSGPGKAPGLDSLGVDDSGVPPVSQSTPKVERGREHGDCDRECLSTKD